jgi:aspartyl-tRNA(Asn)/glutamyl-tRNA(Gln) amidotransferase subunit C
MSITKEQVLATAALARIDLAAGFSPEEADAAVTRLAEQLDAIVAYMDILNHADTDGVEPLYAPLRHPAPPRNDEAALRRTVEEVLGNAPRRHGNFFAVPPVF